MFIIYGKGKSMKIPFNKPHITGKEISYMQEALVSGQQAGNKMFANKVIRLMKAKFQYKSIFLTPSCTAALEMGALLADIKPGDEVILPSYTFSSTVNAVVIFGAVPVFCEVDPKTMNIDVSKIRSLVSRKTRMIIPIDYAGVPCEIDKIMQIADEHKIIVCLLYTSPSPRDS